MAETIRVGRDELIPMPPPRPTPRHRPAQPQRRAAPVSFVPARMFSRTRDIVAASMTDLLDKAEDPAKMIRMIVMEMEETLVGARASAARSIADLKDMSRQIARLEGLQESWVEKAELALSKDREDLAKAALMEKQRVGDVADGLRGEREMLDDILRASEADIARLEAKLREARTRQNAINGRLESAHNRIRMREVYAGSRTEEAFSRFDLLEREVDRAEGRAEALALGAPARTLEEEIAELRNAGKVEAELEALKEKQAGAIASDGEAR
jgi:phage shock protein A